MRARVLRHYTYELMSIELTMKHESCVNDNTMLIAYEKILRGRWKGLEELTENLTVVVLNKSHRKKSLGCSYCGAEIFVAHHLHN